MGSAGCESRETKSEGGFRNTRGLCVEVQVQSRVLGGWGEKGVYGGCPCLSVWVHFRHNCAGRESRAGFWDNPMKSNPFWGWFRSVTGGQFYPGKGPGEKTECGSFGDGSVGSQPASAAARLGAVRGVEAWAKTRRAVRSYGVDSPHIEPGTLGKAVGSWDGGIQPPVVTPSRH